MVGLYKPQKVKGYLLSYQDVLEPLPVVTLTELLVEPFGGILRLPMPQAGLMKDPAKGKPEVFEALIMTC